jgi:hypothetical protein
MSKSSATVFSRSQAAQLAARLAEPRRFIHVVAGPRQVGKTTLVRQVLERARTAAVYASADEPALRGREWIAQQWDAGRLAAREHGKRGALLALDEIHKIPAWSETVKRLWDEDTARRVPLHVVLLGSAPLLMQHGLTETLTGRFEMLHLPHWSFAEMRDAFGWTLERFLFFGGYPGAAPLADDSARWARYVKDALIETTIGRDVLLLTRVDKPVLLRRLFELACAYSGQILAYQKMLGQLQEAGNTTTLAHYLDLLAGAGMVTGLQKFSGSAARQRASSPKLQVLNTALMTAQCGLDPRAARADPEFWGRLVESAVGAYLSGAAQAGECTLYYWRDRNREVDFVVKAGRQVTAIEVKSGRRRDSLAGMEAFTSAFRPQRTLLVGGDGIGLDEFLSRPVAHWVSP